MADSSDEGAGERSDSSALASEGRPEDELEAGLTRRSVGATDGAAASTSSVPCMVADKDAPNCMGPMCPVKFWLWGRHHCRRCGGVFCKACSNYSALIADACFGEPGLAKRRMCRACWVRFHRERLARMREVVHAHEATLIDERRVSAAAGDPFARLDADIVSSKDAGTSVARSASKMAAVRRAVGRSAARADWDTELWLALGGDELPVMRSSRKAFVQVLAHSAPATVPLSATVGLLAAGGLAMAISASETAGAFAVSAPAQPAEQVEATLEEIGRTEVEAYRPSMRFHSLICVRLLRAALAEHDELELRLCFSSADDLRAPSVESTFGSASLAWLAVLGSGLGQWLHVELKDQISGLSVGTVCCRVERLRERQHVAGEPDAQAQLGDAAGGLTLRELSPVGDTAWRAATDDEPNTRTERLFRFDGTSDNVAPASVLAREVLWPSPWLMMLCNQMLLALFPGYATAADAALDRLERALPREASSSLEWKSKSVATILAFCEQAVVGLRTVRQSIVDGQRGDAGAMLFKPSCLKASRDLQFLALNVQVQRLEVVRTDASDESEPVAFQWLTCGAPVAHSLGFKHGGLGAMRRLAESARADLANVRSNDELGQAEGNVWQLEWELRMRTDIVRTQALTIVSSAVLQHVALLVRSEDGTWAQAQLERIAALGFLIHCESLLSSQLAEQGMLDDLAVAMQEFAPSLRCVIFCVDRVATRSLAGVLHRETRLSEALPGDPSRGHLLQIFVRCVADGASVPVSLTESGARVQVVLSTYGINELPVLSQLGDKLAPLKYLGSNAAHAHINARSSEVLLSYYGQLRSYLVSRGEDVDGLDRLCVQLTRVLADQPSAALLQVSSDFVRALCGIRITNCKSGKDRTAMAQTLEAARLIRWCMTKSAGELMAYAGSSTLARPPVDLVGEADDDVLAIASTLRACGVRREVAQQNVGRRRYAFNSLVSRLVLPKAFKPPSGTGAGALES